MITGEEFFTRRNALCYFLASACVTGCAVSLCSMLAISVNRYVYIVHNSRYRKIFTKVRTAAYSLQSGWSVSSSLWVPHWTFGRFRCTIAR